jgi:hypothetical protein
VYSRRVCFKGGTGVVVVRKRLYLASLVMRAMAMQAHEGFEEFEGLPPGTKLLRFDYSDGDAALWVNLDSKYRRVAINEKAAIDWRRKTGKAVARILGLACKCSNIPNLRLKMATGSSPDGCPD